MSDKKPDWMVEVFITLKPSVLDPQGSTVQQALNSMGYESLNDVRLGKYFQLTFQGSLTRPQLEKQVKQMCDKLLANPVIERYHFKAPLEPGSRRVSGRA